jgi:Tol biopolymer transport system component
VSPLEGSGLITFEHFTAGLGTRIEVLQPNGLGKELLPTVPGHQEQPAWRPDGRKLAFAGWDPRDSRARQSIWETDATGASPTLVTVGCEPPVCLEERAPSYSFDGTRMAFVRSAGPVGGEPTSTVVAIRDLATGAVDELEPTRVDSSNGFVDHPSLAPDGRHVAYARILTDADGGATDGSILVVDVDGGAPAAITPDGWEAGDPSWSPDGQRILFGREPIHHWLGGGKGAGQNTFIYTMAPDGSGVTQLTDAGTDFDSAGSPSWAAGGSQIIFIDVPLQTIGTPDIHVMGSDGSDRNPVARFGDCCRWYPVQQPTP